MLAGVENAPSLPYASSLCGACYEVCPVKINIPEVLIHLRGQVVRERQGRDDPHAWPDPEALAMKFLAGVFSDPGRYERAQKLGRFGQRFLLRGGYIERLPGPLAGWTAMRDVYPVAGQTFREWWRSRS
jgi:L-lactate dehydrogenase complex protein LldF